VGRFRADQRWLPRPPPRLAHRTNR
jgi:hypothetical protein